MGRCQDNIVWRSLHRVLSYVTVEPIEFIYCLMFTTSSVVRDNLFSLKVSFNVQAIDAK